MTVIGVAGCTALLITGFGLKDSIIAITEKQFGQIYTYDLKGYLRENIYEGKEESFIDELKNYNEIEDSILSFEKMQKSKMTKLVLLLKDTYLFQKM